MTAGIASWSMVATSIPSVGIMAGGLTIVQSDVQQRIFSCCIGVPEDAGIPAGICISDAAAPIGQSCVGAANAGPETAMAKAINMAINILVTGRQ